MGIASTKVLAEHPDAIRGILAARRKAVDFMNANPEEAVQIIAEAWEMDPEVMGPAILNLLNSTVDGMPYWEPAGFAMNAWTTWSKLPGSSGR